ncbi:protein containing Pyruvate phosphate dikinase, PEP/pyruvate-binding [Candidatus Omnitrophus magneticus]|uniref:Phosphoenolpyruvate synthase n=1 Tax=Candidatus Omnitrophus magneticus TaxID=1609969 RepID=A0A0F0CJS7_9BACT|nr:protein containing Pyruvate phosphate dikinase, PEP/pyruvate-binding [Candidatus Omnitrophus magneticus]
MEDIKGGEIRQKIVLNVLKELGLKVTVEGFNIQAVYNKDTGALSVTELIRKYKEIIELLRILQQRELLAGTNIYLSDGVMGRVYKETKRSVASIAEEFSLIVLEIISTRVGKEYTSRESGKACVFQGDSVLLPFEEEYQLTGHKDNIEEMLETIARDKSALEKSLVIGNILEQGKELFLWDKIGEAGEYEIIKTNREINYGERIIIYSLRKTIGGKIVLGWMRPLLERGISVDIKELFKKIKEEGKYPIGNIGEIKKASGIVIDDIIKGFKERIIVEEIQGKRAVSGIGVSSGVIEGEVVIYKRGEHQSGDLKGKIAVTKSLLPLDNDFIKDAGGLILLGGCPLSHAAIFAQEMGIPCLIVDGFNIEGQEIKGWLKEEVREKGNINIDGQQIEIVKNRDTREVWVIKEGDIVRMDGKEGRLIQLETWKQILIRLSKNINENIASVKKEITNNEVIEKWFYKWADLRCKNDVKDFLINNYPALLAYKKELKGINDKKIKDEINRRIKEMPGMYTRWRILKSLAVVEDLMKKLDENDRNNIENGLMEILGRYYFEPRENKIPRSVAKGEIKDYYDLSAIGDDFGSVVGNKSAKLGELFKWAEYYGYNTPQRGMALSDKLSKEYFSIKIDGKSLIEYITEILQTSGGIVKKEVRIKKLFEREEIKKSDKYRDLKARIEDMYKDKWENNQDIALAVRSSATMGKEQLEDWTGTAGLYKSQLYVTRENLTDNVITVFQSLFSEKALRYYRRLINGENWKYFLSCLGMGVVVQEMVDSDISGVAFSVNPATGEDDFVLTSTYGQGEGLVSGEVSADVFIVDRNGKIVFKKIEEKSEVLMRAATGGVRKVALSEFRIFQAQDRMGGNLTAEQKKSILLHTREKVISSPVLSDVEILNITQMLKSLEQWFGYPVDIELAIRGGQIRIVQVREVTTTNLNKGLEYYEKIIAKKFRIQGATPRVKSEEEKITERIINYSNVYRTRSESDAKKIDAAGEENIKKLFFGYKELLAKSNNLLINLRTAQFDLVKRLRERPNTSYDDARIAINELMFDAELVADFLESYIYIEDVSSGRVDPFKQKWFNINVKRFARDLSEKRDPEEKRIEIEKVNERINGLVEMMLAWGKKGEATKREHGFKAYLNKKLMDLFSFELLRGLNDEAIRLGARKDMSIVNGSFSGILEELTYDKVMNSLFSFIGVTSTSGADIYTQYGDILGGLKNASDYAVFIKEWQSRIKNLTKKTVKSLRTYYDNREDIHERIEKEQIVSEAGIKGTRPGEIVSILEWLYPRVMDIPRVKELYLPTLVLIGGVDMESLINISQKIAQQHGILVNMHTDVIKGVMAKLIDINIKPSLHREYWESVPLEEGYYTQSINVMKGVQAAIKRNLKENASMIITGPALIPGLLKETFYEKANVVYGVTYGYEKKNGTNETVEEKKNISMLMATLAHKAGILILPIESQNEAVELLAQKVKSPYVDQAPKIKDTIREASGFAVKIKEEFNAHPILSGAIRVSRDSSGKWGVCIDIEKIYNGNLEKLSDVDTLFLKEKILELKKKGFSVYMLGLEASINIASSVPALQSASGLLILKMINFAGDIGADVLVINPGKMSSGSKIDKYIYENNIVNLNFLSQKAATKGVSLAIMNAVKGKKELVKKSDNVKEVLEKVPDLKFILNIDNVLANKEDIEKYMQDQFIRERTLGFYAKEESLKSGEFRKQTRAVIRKYAGKMMFIRDEGVARTLVSGVIKKAQEESLTKEDVKFIENNWKFEVSSRNIWHMEKNGTRREGLKNIRNMGYNGVQFLLVGPYHDTESLGTQSLKEDITELGIDNFSLHSTTWGINLSSVNDKLRETAINVVKKGIDIAKRLDIKVMTIHPGQLSYPSQNKEEAWELFLESMQILQEYAYDNCIELALENMQMESKEFVNSPEDLVRAVKNVPGLKLTVDIAHANSFMNPVEYIRELALGLKEIGLEFGDVARVIHISGSNGPGTEDHYLLSDKENSNIDIETVFKELIRNGFKGRVVSESRRPKLEEIELIEQEMSYIRSILESRKQGVERKITPLPIKQETTAKENFFFSDYQDNAVLNYIPTINAFELIKQKRVWIELEQDALKELRVKEYELIKMLTEVRENYDTARGHVVKVLNQSKDILKNTVQQEAIKQVAIFFKELLLPVLKSHMGNVLMHRGFFKDTAFKKTFFYIKTYRDFEVMIKWAIQMEVENIFDKKGWRHEEIISSFKKMKELSGVFDMIEKLSKDYSAYAAITEALLEIKHIYEGTFHVWEQEVNTFTEDFIDTYKNWWQLRKKVVSEVWEAATKGDTPLEIRMEKEDFYRLVKRFYRKVYRLGLHNKDIELPLVGLISGTGASGKSTIGAKLMGRLLTSLFIPMDLIREVIREVTKADYKRPVDRSSYAADDLFGKEVDTIIRFYANCLEILPGVIAILEFLAKNNISGLVEGYSLVGGWIDECFFNKLNINHINIEVASAEAHRRRYEIRGEKAPERLTEVKKALKELPEVRKIHDWLSKTAREAGITCINNIHLEKAFNEAINHISGVFAESYKDVEDFLKEYTLVILEEVSKIRDLSNKKARVQELLKTLSSGAIGQKEEQAGIIIAVYGAGDETIKKLNKLYGGVKLVAIKEINKENIENIIEGYRKQYKSYATRLIDVEGVSSEELEIMVEAIIKDIETEDALRFLVKPELVNLNEVTVKQIEDIGKVLDKISSHFPSMKGNNLGEQSVYEYKFDRIAEKSRIRSNDNELTEKISAITLSGKIKVASFRVENVLELRWLAEEHRKAFQKYGENYPIKLHIRLLDKNVNENNLALVLKHAGLTDVISEQDITLGDGATIEDVIALVKAKRERYGELTNSDIAICDKRDLLSKDVVSYEKMEKLLKGILFARLDKGVASQGYVALIELIANGNQLPKVAPSGVTFNVKRANGSMYVVIIPIRPINIEALREEIVRYTKILIAA